LKPETRNPKPETYEQALARVAELENKLGQLKTRNRQLAAFQQVSQAISVSLNVQQALDAILEQVASIVFFDSATLILVEQDHLRAVAARGFSDESLALNVYPRSSQNSAWRVVQNKTPLIVADVQNVEGWEGRTGLEHIRGWMGIPLIARNQVIGVLTLDSRRPNTYTPEDAQVIFLLAYQVAVAIENARLYRDTAQRLSDLGVLHDAGQALISTLDLDEILSIIMKRACGALAAEYGYALLTNEAKTHLGFAATVGAGAQRLKGQTIPLVGSVMGTVVKQGKTLLINDTASLPQFFAEIDAHVKADTRSLMVAPLKTKGEILGALLVTNKQTGRFAQNNLNLLVSLAQLASGAIENARLFRQVRQYSQNLEEAVVARTVHLTAVNVTSRNISSIVFVDELFARVTQLISELFNQARVSVAMRTGKYLTFQKIFDGGFKSGSVPVNYRLRIDGDHILGRVVLGGKADVVETIDTAELYRLDDDEESPSTALVVPLSIGGKTTGIIAVQTRSWLASQQQDLETLVSLASQVAVAMENARLLQKSREMAIAQERTRLARDMHDGVAQNLAYLLIQVDRCLLMAEDNNPKLPDELEKISQVIARNIEELRRHIFDLRPTGLENRSIYKVLRQTSHEFGEQTGLKSHCRIIGDEIVLSAEVEASLYRIFQEALSNIRRHANCTRVDLVLRTHPDKSLTFSISDNGVGFHPAHLTKNPFQRHGLGLISMQERIRSLGGTLSVDSAPNKGTRIVVNVPGG